MSDKLPQGWVWAKMLDIVDYEGGSQPPKKEFIYESRQGYVRLMQIRDFGDKPFPTYVPDSKRLKKATRDDLLLARYGGSSGSDSLGRVCTGLDGAYNVALAKLIFSRDLLEKDYVRHLFLGRWFREKVSRNSRSCQTGFNREDVQDIEFPVAPLREQRRIAAKLETLLSKVEASQERLAKIPVLLKRFRQSVLAAACSSRLTADWREENPDVDDASGLVAELERIHEAAGGHKKGNAAAPSNEAHDLSTDDLPSTWRLTEMRSAVCPNRPITYGILKPGPETPGGIPYVRVADFPNDRLNLETIRRTTKEIEKTFARARLRAGDILLSIRGTVGRVCVVPPELENASITQDTARLSVQLVLNAAFVKWFLRAAPTQKRMQKAVKGVAVRGINIGDVRALQMPVPPLPEQREIVQRVEGLFALADQLEARYGKATAQVEKLTQSILAKAFRGELVPQDPNDEPASVLLERIKQQREQPRLKKSSKRQQAHVAGA
jgi:type I restriction enzyme S subunit